MFFCIQLSRQGAAPDSSLRENQYPIVVLQKDNWNDYSYLTTCNVTIFTSKEAAPESIGILRVMRRSQEEHVWGLDGHPNTFQSLDKNYCSLSDDLNFYKRLREIGESFGNKFLTALRDAAYKPKIWREFENEVCFKFSLLRNATKASMVRDELPHLFGRKGNAVRRFNYSVHLKGSTADQKIQFDFRKTSFLPHRIVLLVGPNGAGKTQILSKLAIVLSGITREGQGDSAEKASFKKRMEAGHVHPVPSLYKIIAVSFNAFDTFEIPQPSQDALIKYTYCGIRKDADLLKSTDEQIKSISAAVLEMSDENRAILTPVLKNILGTPAELEFSDLQTNAFYQTLSAGQRIVVSILVHLLRHLEKSSLVLIDEPETHLHPGLMTTLISEITRLLNRFNSYAVIATHSPIVAQQIPSKSIRVLGRVDENVEATVPTFECFGENVSEISSSLFRATEHERDYTDILKKRFNDVKKYPDKLERLVETSLGGNARAILLALVSSQSK